MKKAYLLHMLCIIISYSSTHAMWTRASRQWSQLGKPTIRQKRFVQTAPQPKTQTPQTNEPTESPTAITQQIPETQPSQTNVPTESPTPIKQQTPQTKITGSWSIWKTFTNMFKPATSKATPVTASMAVNSQGAPYSHITQETLHKPVNKFYPAESSKNIPPTTAAIIPSVNVQLDVVKTLTEAKTLLTNLTEKELNTIKTKAHISNDAWSGLIKRMHAAVNFIEKNCFTRAHPKATRDADIPKELDDRIIYFSQYFSINPESISRHYRDTTVTDPFEHNVISIIGPTLTYKTDISSVGDIITGYEPAQIIIHKQNIAGLTANEIDAHIQHALKQLKKGHLEELALLKKTLGTENYAQYANPYKKALEREADFLGPIENYHIAKVVQNAFLDKAFKLVLKGIKNIRKKYNLQNKESKNLMVCRPSKKPLEILSIIASLEDLENYFDAYEKNLYITLATTAGVVHYEKIHAFISTLNKEKKFTKTICYQKPLKNIIHDPELPLEEIKQLLRQKNINPDSTNILSTSPLNKSQREKFIKQAQETNFTADERALKKIDEELVGLKDNAGACTPLLTMNYENEIVGYRPAYLCFDKDKLARMTHTERLYFIGHETAHLVECDPLTNSHIEKLETEPQSYSAETIDLLREEDKKKEEARVDLRHLQEIRADIKFAVKNPEFAKKVEQAFEQQQKTPGFKAHKASSSHPSFEERLRWSRKIVDLHEAKPKEKAETRPSVAAQRE